MCFAPSKADLDLWIRKVEDGSYEYIASYVEQIPDGSPKPNKYKDVQVTPPRVDHLDVVGGLTPSMKWKPRIHSAPLTREPGRAVALGRVLVLT
jgi:hypothetical protein